MGGNEMGRRNGGPRPERGRPGRSTRETRTPQGRRSSRRRSHKTAARLPRSRKRPARHSLSPLPQDAKRFSTPRKAPADYRRSSANASTPSVRSGSPRRHGARGRLETAEWGRIDFCHLNRQLLLRSGSQPVVRHQVCRSPGSRRGKGSKGGPEELADRLRGVMTVASYQGHHQVPHWPTLPPDGRPKSFHLP